VAEYPRRWESDVVLADGGTLHLRPVRPDDGDALLSFYTRLSQESLYLRFFSPVPAPTARQIDALTEIDYTHRFALVAELGDDIVAIARFDRLADSEDAEVAFTVRDDQQGRGLGTILLEHLGGVARELGLQRFVASTLPSNRRMLQVFADAGFRVQRRLSGDVIELSFPITMTPASVEAQRAREHLAEAHSVARLLAPSSVAVVGASRRPGTFGHALLRNLLDGDFAGPVFPINPQATSVAGVRAYPKVSAVPDFVDLAIVAVPADEVLDVARDCADKGVAGLVVISAGFAELGSSGAGNEGELVQLARRNGMRVIGPNCMGLVNTDPDVRLRATFAPFAPVTGRIAFASQSGGLGIELLGRASTAGLGVSTFVSMGNKADISSNDLIQYWDDDPETDVILLYLESFGNPQKFARLARDVSRRKPIVALKAGRSAAGERATSSHTAALAAPDVAVDALFRQAGVIRVDTIDELFDVGTLLRYQPLPAGPRVGIITNGGGPGIVAADACSAAGLQVPELSPTAQRELRSFVSEDAAVRNPVDLVASGTAGQYEHALRVLLDDTDLDAVVVLFVPPLVTRAADVAAAVGRACAGGTAKPVIASFLGRRGMLELLPDAPGPGRVPSFAAPEAAVRALGHAARLGEWRRRPEGHVPGFVDVDFERVRALVAAGLAGDPGGAWLEAPRADELLASVGVPVAASRHADDADAAVRLAEEIAGPVALKAASPRLVHKSDRGAVHLNLVTADAVRVAFTALTDTLGDEMGGAVVQPMVRPGVETIVGITRDRVFGSLVLFGMGGFQAELLRDTALRILPLTDLDAHELVRSLRTSPLLFGYRHTPLVDVDALESLLLRVAQLAEVAPEIAELDANPVVVSADGAVAVDVKVRLAPMPALVPDVRRLRDPVRT
jgi:acetyl coenzyme A synthetase (ADP forming)-like protein